MDNTNTLANNDTMNALEKRLKDAFSTYIGYPCGCVYDFSPVIKFFSMHINNVGDPYSSSTYRVNSKEIEREVLDFFANLWGINKERVWGYITSSGTEGNLQGLYIGRESAKNRPHVFFTSKDSHYSIFKIVRLLQLNLCVIESQENGEIDYKDFDEKVSKHADKYIIINANLGTTMKGAMDNTQEIYRILRKHHKHNESYIHMDGALSGFYLPFLEKDLFFKSHVNSMSISGHKFMSVPFPCGVFMVEKDFLDLVKSEIEYIGSTDCMISGSRSGHAPIFMKHIIDVKKIDGFKKDIDKCLELAEYATTVIDGSWRNHNSITVIIPKPRDEIIYKWQLATEKDISHLVVMPHVTKEKIDEFVADLQSIDMKY